MKVEPVVLQGRKLRLEPLSEHHFEALWKHVDPDLFRYMNLWWVGDGHDDFLESARKSAFSPGFVTFAMVLQETGAPIGSSAYLDIRPEHRTLEIGATWIGRSYQATFVNPEAKYLMLSHAFDTLGCIRVQLKTDGRNQRSMAAMEKLGCTREGLLRKHMICRDGHLRDTAMYSILDDEWPSVKKRLVERLGYDPAATEATL